LKSRFLVAVIIKKVAKIKLLKMVGYMIVNDVLQIHMIKKSLASKKKVEKVINDIEEYDEKITLMEIKLEIERAIEGYY
tara:strand:- start:27 stop:263 length:237 start_codon:yes stop_codon:yes gene_type:complete